MKYRRLFEILAIVTGSLGLLVLIIFTTILAMNYSINGQILPEDTGITGDFIGGVVGTLWSFTGVSLFYLALTYQRADLSKQQEAIELQAKELSIQSEQLELQKDEMIEMRKVVTEQSQTMKIQKFETTFFNLVQNHSHLISSGAYINGKIGNEAIDQVKNQIQSHLREIKKVLTDKTIENQQYWNGYPESLMRILSRFSSISNDTFIIIQFIDKAEISEKEFYHAIVRNNMSFSEEFLFGLKVEFGKLPEGISLETLYEYRQEYCADRQNILLNDEVLPPKVQRLNAFSKEQIPAGNLYGFLNQQFFGFESNDDRPLKLVSFKSYNEKTNETYSNEFLSNTLSKNEPVKIELLRQSSLTSNKLLVGNIVYVVFEIVFELENAGIYTHKQFLTLIKRGDAFDVQLK